MTLLAIEILHWSYIYNSKKIKNKLTIENIFVTYGCCVTLTEEEFEG